MKPTPLWDTGDVATRLGFRRPDGAPDRKRAHEYLTKYCREHLRQVGRSIRVEPEVVEASTKRRRTA